MTLRIGISARLLHNPPPGLGLPTKRLQFLESGMATWIMSHGVVALMIPFIDQRTPTLRKRPPLGDLVDHLDGLVLQGGIDISPETYGADPWQPKAEYDPIRDEYELELLRGFIDANGLADLDALHCPPALWDVTARAALTASSTQAHPVQLSVPEIRRILSLSA